MSATATRIETVMQNLAERNLSQMLVCDPRSIQYLTGAYVEPGERFLGLILAKGAEPMLVLNELFTAPDDCTCTVRPYSDTDDPLALVAELCDADEALGCDKNLAARFLIPLMERGAAARFVLASDAVDDARALKDEAERAAMRAASHTNDAAMARFRELVHEGVTESEVAGQLEGIYRDLGAQGHSFTPIVSFGANAADPHHEPDNTRLAPGDVVLFDVGCRQDEYCADMTRTFFFGEPTNQQREVYETVRRANEAARALVKPGVRFCDLDRAARAVIEEAGYGPYFTHRLGHQIGLDVHEPGDVSATHNAPVEPGMCFSIEPGIYLPGNFGVRIEDLVLVTEEGCEVLNSYPRELTVL
ncbi:MULTISPECIES: M24 family metallopeptidase [Gordonibacter]|uniref:Aminopeptidase P family protein n=1 Tax=Gordonibacter faecis TaxID=3047475 RepID=A0ABT7DLK4_9ACTN|nr:MULTISPECIES: aminopeptidase P family protein [unclassified Gordonibacter]MDJ1650406.1 aminopeptidase P family protein [Gordonibacter sp. KGMB12511]HIW76749.1 aminopeptidase P family protein [Candidatus Gordonibacter avicola]